MAICCSRLRLLNNILLLWWNSGCWQTIKFLKQHWGPLFGKEVTRDDGGPDLVNTGGRCTRKGLLVNDTKVVAVLFIERRDHNLVKIINVGGEQLEFAN